MRLRTVTPVLGLCAVMLLSGCAVTVADSPLDSLQTPTASPSGAAVEEELPRSLADCRVALQEVFLVVDAYRACKLWQKNEPQTYEEWTVAANSTDQLEETFPLELINELLTQPSPTAAPAPERPQFALVTVTGSDYLVNASATKVSTTGVSTVNLADGWTSGAQTYEVPLGSTFMVLVQARASNMIPDVTCKVTLGDRVLSEQAAPGQQVASCFSTEAVGTY